MKDILIKLSLLVFVTTLIASCANKLPIDCECRQQLPENQADTIYIGGDIITMNDAQPSAEAIAVKDGKILSVGQQKDVVRKHQGTTTEVIDLQKKSLLPGFLDAHSHYYSSLSVSNQVNVFPRPSGPGKDVKSIVAELVKFRNENKIPAGVLIQAYGYDDTVMPNGRLLNRDDLDADFPENPVIVGHISMHGGVLNSAAMKRWGINADTETPPGGIIVRKPSTNEPYGLIMETAWLPIFSTLPVPDAKQAEDLSRAGQMLYARAGITTAHEGATHAADLALMKIAADAGSNIIDIIAYPFITDLEEILKVHPIKQWGKYNNRLKIGALKLQVTALLKAELLFSPRPI